MNQYLNEISNLIGNELQNLTDQIEEKIEAGHDFLELQYRAIFLCEVFEWFIDSFELEADSDRMEQALQQVRSLKEYFEMLGIVH